MADLETPAPLMGRREGSRWVNMSPGGDELAEWFTGNVKLHAGLEHADYIAGIALIQQTSKNRKAVVGFNDDGRPIFGETEDVIYTPYPRVDTRVAYFWRLMELHPEWTGKIEPVQIHTEQSSGLPPGYFRLDVPISKDGGTAVTPMIGRAMQVRILERGQDLHVYPSESKIVPLVNRYNELDEHAMARASTGAIGRALGVAGMLVLPGTGIASAEDVQEALNDTPGARIETAAVVPAQTETVDEMRERLVPLVQQLDASDKREAWRDWWRQRGFPQVPQLEDGQVKIALQQAERMAADAVAVEQ